MKKVMRFFFSMKFALILLVILVIACTVGSVIPQGEIISYYQTNYSTQMGGLILAFGLNDVFHCVWFVALTVILCLNLLGCNILRFPNLIKRTKNGYTPDKFFKAKGKRILTSNDPKQLFEKSGFRKTQSTVSEDGTELLYGVKNIIGIWGAWLCHLGMLIIIVGFGLGQMMQVKYSVYGVAGQTKTIEDDQHNPTKYELTIDDFEVGLREDETVEQYTATITVKDTETGESESGQTSVNNPLSLFGMRFYQNSTGWAADVLVFKDDELIQSEVLCAGEYMYIKEKEGLAVMFSAFYPDYVEGPDGTPATISSSLNNPAYLYRLYYNDQILGMNVLEGKEAITVDAYTIIFTNPRSYTLIQIKRDPFTWLAAIGAVLVMVALLLAFYIRTSEVLAVKLEDGSWHVYGRSRKGGADFVEMLIQKHKEMGGEIQNDEGEKS